MKAAHTIAFSAASRQSTSGSGGNLNHGAIGKVAPRESQLQPGHPHIGPPHMELPSLESASAAFDVVFDSSGEALLILDRAGVIQRANHRARGMIRFREASARASAIGDSYGAGMRLADLIPDSAASELASLLGLRAPASSQGSTQFSDQLSDQSIVAPLASDRSIRMTLRAMLPVTQHLLICLDACSSEKRPATPSHDPVARHLEAELRAILDSVPAGAVLLDRAGSLRFVSSPFGEFFALDAAQLAKIETFRDLDALVSPLLAIPGAFASPWQSFMRGAASPKHDELELQHPVWRLLDRFSRPVLDSFGQAVGWLEIYSDITRERRQRSTMVQTEKMAALGQLVSGIAHELNNPLTTIMGYAQLLLGHGLKPQQLAEATRVFQEAERACRIVKNLLYFARTNKTEQTCVDLNQVVERTLALRSYELKMENIQVFADLAPGLPQTIADPLQLQQVVLNLLINAEQALLEYRGHGNVRIRTSLIMRGPQPHDHIVLEVSDDGPGIPPEHASRVFEPFFTSKPPGAGTGLGLSIIYGIVHQHGGEVTFESRPGAGARFIVDLPVVPVPDSFTYILPTASSEPAKNAPGRILIVEDEPAVAQLMVDVLREEGHQAESVLNSQDGLTLISRHNYDLVVCDLRMPQIDGQAFYDALVSSGSPMSDRVIIVTGDVLAARTREFLDRTRLPYLAKPFLVEELKLAVARLLSSESKPSAGPSAKQIDFVANHSHSNSEPQ